MASNLDTSSTSDSLLRSSTLSSTSGANTPLSTTHLHSLASTLSCPDTPLPIRLETISQLRTHFTSQPPSPHFVLPPNSNGIFLPSLDWSLFRKGYTLLFWLHISQKKEGKGYIHKFHSKPNHGVQTTWKNDVFTAVTLPRQHKPDRGGTFFQESLVLPEKEWMLFAVKHSFPYLKKPSLSVSINGSTLIASELSYPVPEGWMSHGTILSHFPFQMEVGSVGLFSDVLQDETLALIAEYGPRSCGGIIPVIPAVPSHREGMYVVAYGAKREEEEDEADERDWDAGLYTDEGEFERAEVEREVDVWD
eukprot:CAMPEP_0172516430 /NCGR_PEP_ID=MMETSP1066-20121228/276189_1 /TAXON_ID=671091 /ORGANISM="Coscinodiscus wailesii, Strain CCMP2513" /LENGTH=305 /DNA_ID=CAMNT_0013297915 /DNA_START=126 /DNA_END=1042 /DNA_ORIENTATION=-